MLVNEPSTPLPRQPPCALKIESPTNEGLPVPPAIVPSPTRSLEDGEVGLINSTPINDPTPLFAAAIAAAPITLGELKSPRPPKKRKLDTSATKKNKPNRSNRQVIHGNENNIVTDFIQEENFWDDSELIDSWNRAMDRIERKELGELVSESSDGGETNQMETDFGFSAEPPTPSALNQPVGDQESFLLSDQELLHRIAQHQYLAGYYTGIHECRNRNSKSSAG